MILLALAMTCFLAFLGEPAPCVLTILPLLTLTRAKGAPHDRAQCTTYP